MDGVVITAKELPNVGEQASPQRKSPPLMRNGTSEHSAGDERVAERSGDDSNSTMKKEEPSEVTHTALERRRSSTLIEVKEHANSRLRDELLRAQKDLKLKDEECRKLSRIQEQMGLELEELTASLFEEANNMVQEANVKRMQSEKFLTESNAKIDVLQAEVTALKALVITSTPSMPNKHLHPQLDAKKTEFVKGHRRSTSHHNFSKDIQLVEVTLTPEEAPKKEIIDDREVDPVFYEELTRWRQSPHLTTESAFLNRMIREDIEPCLNFRNVELSKSVFDCVLKNTLTIEPVPEKCPFARAYSDRKASLPVDYETALPRKCALTDSTCVCKYRIKLGDAEHWNCISQFSRNRIAAVCDFLTYARYITQGLVKSDEKGVYWEMIRLRKQMALAKLGLTH